MKFNGWTQKKIIAYCAERNAKIYQRRLDGLTLRAIGLEFQISKERVRQLIAIHKRRKRICDCGGEKSPLSKTLCQKCIERKAGL